MEILRKHGDFELVLDVLAPSISIYKKEKKSIFGYEWDANTCIHSEKFYYDTPELHRVFVIWKLLTKENITMDKDFNIVENGTNRSKTNTNS